MAARNETSKKKQGPNPAHVLLASISRALETGVDSDRIIPILDMARNAIGVQQAPVWRMCAATLDGYSEAIKPGVTGDATSG